MAMGKHGIRNIAAIVAVIVVVAVVLAVFVLPGSPHFGFVSMQQTNSITHNNFSSSKHSTSTVSNSSSGEKKGETMEYSSGGALSVTISIIEYNTSSNSAKAFGNFTAILGGAFSLSLTSASLLNYTYKGFKIAEGDINASLLGFNVFFASGVDGNYMFLIIGFVSSISSSEITALANAQASAMV